MEGSYQSPGLEGSGLLTLDRVEVLGMLREGLTGLGAELGLLIARQLLESEVEEHCGRKRQRSRGRRAYRHTPQGGFVTLAGQKLPVLRPRMRSLDGRSEVEMETYALLQRPEALSREVLARLVRGVSCRDYEGVIERAREAVGVKRSSVSRHFVRASARDLKEFCNRPIEGRFVVIYVDGVEYGGETVVVVLGVTLEGRKEVLGLRQGATENAVLCKELLEELVDRGLSSEEPTLFVLDGAKALRKAVRALWGEKALVQRCRIHKGRNVREHLEEKHHEALAQRLRLAWGMKDYKKALKSLQTTAAWLERLNPDAAASLREGMEETLTVTRLGVEGTLLKSVSNTNVIESSLSVARTVTGRVKRWRPGEMRKRWLAAGLLRAQEKFRRVRGYRDLPHLARALERETAAPCQIQEAA